MQAIRQGAELDEAVNNLQDYLRTDWAELNNTIANGAAFLLDLHNNITENYGGRLDGNFFMVADMLNAVTALMDYVKPFYDPRPIVVSPALAHAACE